jgi:hypothetical protein
MNILPFPPLGFRPCSSQRVQYQEMLLEKWFWTLLPRHALPSNLSLSLSLAYCDT